MSVQEQGEDYGKNDHRFDDLLGKVKKLGEQLALGNDSLARTAAMLASAAHEGVLSTTKNTHGRGVDDAKYLYTEYVKACSNKNIFDMSENSVSANSSKFRVIIEAGMATTYDIMTTFNRGHLIRKELAGAEVKVKPAFAAYVDMARALVADGRNGADLTDDEIKEIVTRAEPRPKTVRKIVEEMQKKAESLITSCSCQEPELIQAEELVRELLKKI
jgi:hypothetical protein